MMCTRKVTRTLLGDAVNSLLQVQVQQFDVEPPIGRNAARANDHRAVFKAALLAIAIVAVRVALCAASVRVSRAVSASTLFRGHGFHRRAPH